MKVWDVIVVGAGAAGLIAAGKAALDGQTVLLIEKMERPGRKLLITGKGRCNITNMNSIAEHMQHIFPNGRFLKQAYGTFFNNDMVNLLQSLGVETITERGNRVFPESEKSAHVVDALFKWVTKNGVQIMTNCTAQKLCIENEKIKGLLVEYDQQIMRLNCTKLIICTGGKSYPATGSTGEGYVLAKQAGHSIAEPRPALVPLETAEKTAAQMQGLALKNVTASVWVNGKKITSEFGEMLFTHFGLSGPIILTLSRIVTEELLNGNTVQIIVDIKPALDDIQLDKRLLRDLEEHAKKQLKQIFKLWLPSSMIPVFLEQLELDGSLNGSELRSEQRKKIRLFMKNMKFNITKYRPFSEAIITAGGIKCNEIDNKTMQSKLIKGLYFAGEVIDLDADTGGYNLQIAWSTGWLAGSNQNEVR